MHDYAFGTETLKVSSSPKFGVIKPGAPEAEATGVSGITGVEDRRHRQFPPPRLSPPRRCGWRVAEILVNQKL